MNKKEMVKKIEEILDRIYPDPPIPLVHTDIFSLLAATFLSAQCINIRVNIITPKLFKTYPDVYAMAKAPVPAIKELIKSCGLSSTKAKALSRLSNIIVKKHDGKVPDSFEALEELPGVGHKTASVIMCQGFSVPAFPVDTHIHRLAKRWKLSNGSSVVQTEKDLKKVFKKNTWNLRHLQIIYFGREYCPARGHNPETCPICSLYL